MKFNLRIALTSLLMTSFVSLPAQTFRTENLKRAAGVTGVVIKPDSLLPEQSFRLKAKDGYDICLRTNPMGVVEHIGIPLFSDVMRVLQPSPVYDFLEYAVLNWKYKVTPNQLYLSRVIFRKGSWNTLLKERISDCLCSITNQDEKLYILSWSKKTTETVDADLERGDEVAVIGIPIDYELLNNDTRRNMERTFVDELSEYRPKNVRPNHSPIDDERLSIYGTEGLFVMPGRSYILDILNQNVYYRLSTVYEKVDTVIRNEHVSMTLEAVQPVTVSDLEFPAESFANLMMCDDSSVPDVTMQLDFHLSDYHRRQVTMPLSWLKSFCRQEGCGLYFACDGVIGEKVRGVMFASNLPRGYNHFFSLRIRADELTSKTPLVQADVYLYIPPLEKTKLFGTAPTKKSGAKFTLP